MATRMCEGKDALERFAKRLMVVYGAPVAGGVQRILIEELGGMRVTIPDLRQLNRSALYDRIRKEFNGANCTELSLRSGLSPRQIRRIVNGD